MNQTPHIQYAVRTDLGRVRKNNEDNYIEFVSPERRWIALGAIDGVGGYEGGEIAALICKENIELKLAQAGNNALSNPLQFVRELLIEANNAIWEQARVKPELSSMSCVATFAILDTRSQLLYFAHVGDTRAYIFRNNELIKFTHDHSVVGYLEDSGAILEQDALNHPRRNEILKSLGEKHIESNDNDFVEAGTHSFYANDIVLFCSDGLTDLLLKNAIAHILSTPASLHEKVNLLVDRANALGGKDNITVALASYSASVVVSQYESEENVILSSRNNTPTPKKPKKTWMFFILAFIAGATLMFALDYFVLNKDKTDDPKFDMNVDFDSLRTTPIDPDSILPDSLSNDTAQFDSTTFITPNSNNHAR